MKRIGWMLAAVTAAALLAGCSSAGSPPAGSSSAAPSAAASFPVALQAANGPVTIKAKPGRIVSLSATATEDLYADGAGPQVVAVDDDSDYPADAPVTKLSGLTPNLEAIAKYKPALVIAALRQSNRTLAEMESEDLVDELDRFPAESPRQDVLSTAQSQGFGREL